MPCSSQCLYFVLSLIHFFVLDSSSCPYSKFRTQSSKAPPPALALLRTPWASMGPLDPMDFLGMDDFFFEQLLLLLESRPRRALRVSGKRMQSIFLSLGILLWPLEQRQGLRPHPYFSQLFWAGPWVGGRAVDGRWWPRVFAALLEEGWPSRDNVVELHGASTSDIVYKVHVAGCHAFPLGGGWHDELVVWRWCRRA